MKPKTFDTTLQLGFLLVGLFMGETFWSWATKSAWTCVWQGVLLYTSFSLVSLAQISFCVWFEDAEGRSAVRYSSIYTKLYYSRSIFGFLCCSLLFWLYSEYGQQADFIALVSLANWTFGNYAASLTSERTPAADSLVDSPGRAL